MKRLLRVQLGICSAFLLGGTVCSARQPQPQEVHRLEFTGPEEGWPPHPKGRTNVQPVHSKEIPGSLTDAREAEIRQAALADPRVRKLLGERFAYITTEGVEPNKCCPPHPVGGPLAAKLTFYSHTNNVTVEVLVVGTTVRHAQRKEGYQPAEGAEEVTVASRLARADAGLRDKVVGLSSEALLVTTYRGELGFGHRVLYVTFSKMGENTPPIYFAYVDLTDQKVLAAGPIKP